MGKLGRFSKGGGFFEPVSYAVITAIFLPENDVSDKFFYIVIFFVNYLKTCGIAKFLQGFFAL